MLAAGRFGAPDQIRFSSLSIFNTPPRPSVMAMLKGYADDSRPNDRVWAVGGYVGHDLQWEKFEADWPKMLAKHGVPYFHMREMGDPNGVYKKWHPPKAHYDEIAGFFIDVVKVISDCWLRPYFSISRTKDLERFNAENSLDLEAYPLAAYGCMLQVASDFPKGVTAEIIFDHVEKVSSKLAKASEYAETDGYYDYVAETIVAIPLNKTLTFREIIPLQAADFLIWELQKNHLKLEDWFFLSNKPTDPSERTEHMDKWAIEKYGSIRPPARKSLEALIDSGAPGRGIIWDYDNLRDANKLRGGVWA